MANVDLHHFLKSRAILEICAQGVVGLSQFSDFLHIVIEPVSP